MNGKVLELRSERDFREGYEEGYKQGKADFTEKTKLLEEIKEKDAIIAYLKGQLEEKIKDEILMNKNYEIKLDYDEEVKVWTVICDDIGLALEADSLDYLMERLKDAVPEMIELNDTNADEDRMYNRIVEKLGFNPRDYRYTGNCTEDDAYQSPFSKLTLEELEYLVKNHLL